MSDAADEAQRIANEVVRGERDYEVLYRIPAREGYSPGDEVGFVKSDEWLFAMNWANGEFASGRYAIEPGDRGAFPSATKWMITNNTAIDYGLDP